MPLIYRSMTLVGSLPMVGPTAKALGVRVPADIQVDADGKVSPGRGGMSVVPSWRRLPMHRIPNRLKHLVPKASGKNSEECWELGEGPFEEGSISEGLFLRPDRPNHGSVEPSEPMSLQEYEGHLAATRDRWRIVEETRQ